MSCWSWIHSYGRANGTPSGGPNQHLLKNKVGRHFEHIWVATSPNAFFLLSVWRICCADLRIKFRTMGQFIVSCPGHFLFQELSPKSVPLEGTKKKIAAPGFATDLCTDVCTISRYPVPFSRSLSPIPCFPLSILPIWFPHFCVPRRDTYEGTHTTRHVRRDETGWTP